MEVSLVHEGHQQGGFRMFGCSISPKSCTFGHCNSILLRGQIVIKMFSPLVCIERVSPAGLTKLHRRKTCFRPKESAWSSSWHPSSSLFLQRTWSPFACCNVPGKSYSQTPSEKIFQALAETFANCTLQHLCRFSMQACTQGTGLSLG